MKIRKKAFAKIQKYSKHLSQNVRLFYGKLIRIRVSYEIFRYRRESKLIQKTFKLIRVVSVLSFYQLTL